MKKKEKKETSFFSDTSVLHRVRVVGKWKYLQSWKFGPNLRHYVVFTNADYILIVIWYEITYIYSYIGNWLTYYINYWLYRVYFKIWYLIAGAVQQCGSRIHIYLDTSISHLYSNGLNQTQRCRHGNCVIADGRGKRKTWTIPVRIV